MSTVSSGFALEFAWMVTRSVCRRCLIEASFLVAFYRAMLCIRGTSRPCVRLSVRPPVRPSVTSRCSTKRAKRRITQTTPHDSAGNLVFWCQISHRNSTGVTPYRGTKCRLGGSNSTNNRLYLETVKHRHIISMKVVCALSNGGIAHDLQCPVNSPNHPIFCILHRHS